MKKRYKKSILRKIPYLLSMASLIIGICSAVFQFQPNLKMTSYQTPSVPGQNYQICGQNASQYLSSPWTYSGSVSGTGPGGSQTYTVAQYEALSGYGTILPPLPSYISSESSATEAAVIFAPGATVSLPGYDFPNTPLLYFFEGGTYGPLSISGIPGDEFIGGSATGFSEPAFSGSSNTNISAQNASYDFSGGGSVLAGTAAVGATSITTMHAIPGYIEEVNFPDGTTYNISSVSGTTINLSSALTTQESSGTLVWANRISPYTYLSAAGTQGATTVQTQPMSVPIVPWEYLNIGANNGLLDTVQVTAVSGSETAGYTLTLRQPISTAAATGAPVYYFGVAGDITAKYLNIGSGGGNFTFFASDSFINASGWTIEYNDVHDNYAGGANYETAQANGQAVTGADNSTVEYNCFQRLGEYALNGGGENTVFNYNQVDNTPYNGVSNGASGCGKWWGSLNNDIVNNSFTNEHNSVCVWFDNGNAGMLVQGNYFNNINGRAIQNETGWNSEYNNNLFVNDAAGIYLNSSGGWNIPGSNYNNEEIVSANNFYNVVTPINIWQSGARSCLNSGEGSGAIGVEEGSSDYCSDGFPQKGLAKNAGQYASHYSDAITGNPWTVALDQSCSTANPCGTSTNPLILSGPPQQNDWIGFQGPQTTAEQNGSVTTTLSVSSTTGFPSMGELEIPSGGGCTYDIYTYTSVVSATQLGGLSMQTGCNGGSTLTSGATPITLAPSYVTTTTDSTPVTSFGGAGNGSVTTLNVGSTAGFPPSGNLLVQTSAQNSGGGVGAVISYSSIASSTQFAGVQLLSDPQGVAMGAGSLASGDKIEAVMPYHVTSVSCPGGNCTNNTEVQVSPSITSNVTQGDQVFDTGTCHFYDTVTATPSQPLDPGGSNSYWDDCQWQTRNISVSGNTFYINGPQFNAAAYPWGGTWGQQINCTTGVSGSCGQNIVGYQLGGPAPYNNQTESNAMMSSPSLSSPLNNLNASGSPFVGGSSGLSANSELPYNTAWTNNTYMGGVSFQGYTQASTCTISWSGTALEWGSSGTNACSGLGFKQWQSYWGQDSSSSYNPITVAIGNLTAGQSIHGKSQSISAFEDSGTSGGITSNLLVNGATASTITAAPYNFALNTLNYKDGSYTLEVQGTDSGGNTDSDSSSVYISNGDLNNDGKVSISDLAIMASHWGQTDSNYADGNITSQGTINISDLAVLAANWGWAK